MRIVIVGGGITGLAAAHAFAQDVGPHEVTLLEARDRLGGNIITERRDGFTIDGGPDSWVASKPQATALARAVGLGDDLMPSIASTRRMYIAWNGELHALPEGLVLAVPTRIMPMVKTGLFSWDAKLRMVLEPVIVPRDLSGDEDESIGDFVTRRLGEQVTERLAGPLLGGIFAGDASTLSIRATFPQLVEAERKHGSLIMSMRAQRAASGAVDGATPPSAFLSLRGGMHTLIDAVAKNLGSTKVRTGVRVKTIASLAPGDERGRFLVVTDSGEGLHADHVILAAPAHAAAEALRDLHAPMAAALAEFRYASTATAFLAFRREDVSHPLDGVGFIVPRALGRPILAATWVSSKWENRAPDGYVLMRTFFGGAWGEETLALDDDALAAVGCRELGRFMGLDAKPIFSRVFRFNRSNPQPQVGHLKRVAAIRAMGEQFPGLHVAGAGYEGVGIPDCVRQGQYAAARVLASG